jgi:hypothetical protein
MVPLGLMLPDAAILPRPLRDDQLAERHSHAGTNDRCANSSCEKRCNEKGPANFAGPFPVLKPVPE